MGERRAVSPRLRTHPPARPTRFPHWKESLRDVPDLRWDEVQRIRQAIRRDAYDDEAILERLLDRFQDDVGILCRKPGTGS